MRHKINRLNEPETVTADTHKEHEIAELHVWSCVFLRYEPCLALFSLGKAVRVCNGRLDFVQMSVPRSSNVIVHPFVELVDPLSCKIFTLVRRKFLLAFPQI